MIINELAYKVTIKADEFLNGKKKVEEGVKELQGAVDKSLAILMKRPSRLER
jgi:hypothetical protein